MAKGKTRQTTDGCRPRVEGEREAEILEAAVELLHEVGYDRLTMDAVAQRARASKATLYRRWESKQSLVVDALIRSKNAVTPADVNSGSLREDLIGIFCGSQGMANQGHTSTLGSVITALHSDPVFAAEFRTRYLAPKIALTQEVYRRAAERGDLAPGADPALLGPALAGILLHHAFLLGQTVTPALVERVIDQIILPAATGRHPSHQLENS